MASWVSRVRKEAALCSPQEGVRGNSRVSGVPSLAGMSGWSRLLGVGALCKVFVLSVVLTLALTSAAFAQLLPESTLSINDITVTEGDAGTKNATFTVTRSGDQTLVSTVNFATANDTATQPSDYASTSGTLTFAAGETKKTVTVSVNGDTEDESDETFFVDLSTAVNATISDSRGVGTIIDDDYTPQANDDGSAANPITLVEDDPNGVTTDVLANDTGLGDTPITVEVTTTPSKGTATVNADKTITYKPKANENGPDTYRYTVTDSDGQTSTARVYLQITPVNDAPLAQNGSATTEEDTSKLITLSANDVDGDSLSYKVTSVPAYGKLYKGESTDAADEIKSADLPASLGGYKVTYVPNPNYNNEPDSLDTFKFRANDGTVDSDEATVSVRVNAVNDAPVAKDDTAQTDEDTELRVDAPGVLDNDEDVDNANLTAILVDGPSHGEPTLNANGSFTYKPDENFNGSDSFTYKANDGTADSNVATVNITIIAVTDAPSFAKGADQTVN